MMDPLLIGIFLDVSGSMKKGIRGDIHEGEEEWVRSIFSVIDDLIKHDVSQDNHVFAFGVGASHEPSIFDLIGTLKKVEDVLKRYQHLSVEKIIQRILEILHNGGASTVRKWAPMSILEKSLSQHKTTCSLMLRKLESDKGYVRHFVHNCLPSACRDFTSSEGGMTGMIAAGLGGNYAYSAFASVACNFHTATEEDIIEVVEKAVGKLSENFLIGVSGKSIFDVHTAHSILHGSVGENRLTNDRIQELKKTVQPFIYGGTPLFGALERSLKLFSNDSYLGHKKLMFVLSDGHPADKENEEHIFSKLKKKDVTVVSCFITAWTSVNPYHMHCTVDEEWERGAKFMFELSSTIETQLLPRTILAKHEWKIDIENNETKLFLQVNHPDHLKDACNLARDLVTCQDALSDVLASVDLDIYINQSNTAFGAQAKQIGGTCYAHASATVLHLAMKRILGREGGYHEFDTLRDQLINEYGDHGANTQSVLEKVCPQDQYRLRCERVDINGAMRAIISKRPVVATFRLTTDEWEKFGEFFTNNPGGVLSTNEVDIRRPGREVETAGHAVVLTSYNSKCLRFMNSWGPEWADGGFFRVMRIPNTDVLGMKFFDVFWTLDDLTSDEKAYYATNGARVAGKFISTLTGLQKAEFQCPLCHIKSKVTQFTGRVTQAKCPDCQGVFRCGDAENLALNLYLTSLGK